MSKELLHHWDQLCKIVLIPTNFVSAKIQFFKIESCWTKPGSNFYHTQITNFAKAQVQDLEWFHLLEGFRQLFGSIKAYAVLDYTQNL